MLNSMKIPTYREVVFLSVEVLFPNIFCGKICRFENDSYLCSALREKHY